MGGDFISVPNFQNPVQIVRFLHCLLGDRYESFRLSPRHQVWSLIILHLHGFSAQFLEISLKRIPEMTALLKTAPNSSDQLFLCLENEKEWVREVILLNKYREICQDREILPSDELQFSSNAALTSYMVLFGDQPADVWAEEFVAFWIQFLSGLSSFFDQKKNQILSIHAAQTAHVVMQHINVSFSEKYKILHFLRCSDARRTWYWLAIDENVEGFVHCAAHRNTESISISRLLEEFGQANSAQTSIPIHLFFDLVECDRNLLGNMIIFWSKPEGKDKASDLIPRVTPSVIHRLSRTAMELIRFFEDKKDTCFHFGWRIRVAKQAEEKMSEDSPNKEDSPDDPPVGMRELAWTTEVIMRILNGEKFDFDLFSDEFGWVGELWGNGWHTPFDRLGDAGFRPVISSKGEGKSGSVVRAGCAMVVFETIRDPNGGIVAHVMERLWPIPNEKGETHHGEYAKA
jgi:hypothetical protein